jgi:hypothetical protein
LPMAALAAKKTPRLTGSYVSSFFSCRLALGNFDRNYY